jgi:signal transduction histidine kinase
MRECRAVVRAHLKKGGEATLEQGYELGRKALDHGLGVVDMGAIYHRVLAEVLARVRTPRTCTRTVKSLEDLFVETLSPYEMTHRGYRDAHATLRRLNELLENEAKRIAHALHDESGQLLVAVNIAIEELASELPPSLQGKLETVRVALDEMEEQLRNLSRELRPPLLDDLGLMPALEFLVEGFSKRTKLNVILNGSTGKRVPAPVEFSIYRIVHEALTNINKHAKASRALIRIERSSRLLSCSIRDDGIGFDVARVQRAGIRRGLGLPGIQERVTSLGGTTEIKSSRRGGTEILTRIPLGS